MDRKTLFLVFLSLIDVSISYDRKISSDMNPQCGNCNSKYITLLYVKAEGDNDIIHNFWDFTYGKPTIIFALTDKNVTCDVQWENALPKSIRLSDKPKYSMGVIIDKIWEFNDVNDTGTLKPENINETQIIDMRGTLWERVDLMEVEGEVMVKVKSKGLGNGIGKRNGTVTIKLDLYPYTSYAFELPHLIHSANSTLVDIILENLTTSKEFNKSRFALDLLFISTEMKDDSMAINIRKGLDDEHTPGIFEIIELITPQSSQNGDGGFIQFRPVSYTEELRDVSTSTQVHMGNMVRGDIPINTTAEMFFGNISGFTMLKENLRISLGGKGDGYYGRTRYNIWSFTLGYGNPPMEGFSMFVILVISIGLGIPVFLMLTGGVYICIRRRSKRNNQPEILIED